MEQSSNLSLPYIASSQNQKHITHNEAIQMLDAIVQASVVSKSIASPPANPDEGSRYIVGANAQGIWAGRSDQFAAFHNGAWVFFQPNQGWIVWVEEEAKYVGWDGAQWVETNRNPSDVQNTLHVGVRATADDWNRLSISSPASLFNHAGNGHQLKINKQAAWESASLLFDSNGRAAPKSDWLAMTI